MTGPRIPFPSKEYLEGLDLDAQWYVEEQHFLALQSEYERLRTEQLRNDSTASDIKIKGRYGIGIFVLILFWLGAVLCIIYRTGTLRLALSERVLLALIGSTTANLVGLLYIVFSSLFPKRR